MGKKIISLTQVAKVYSWFLWGVLTLFSSMAHAEEETLPKPIFKLTKGQGTEVCDAYLQRLNATEFVDNDPVKGRITESLLKGFVDLKPVPLTVEEVQRMYYKIASFNRFRDQDLLEKYRKLHKNDEEKKWYIEEAQKLPERIKSYMTDGRQTPFVRYQKKLDMDNDGSATDKVIKNIYSLCIVNEKLNRIDEAKMMAIFADKELIKWSTIMQFPPLAVLTNVFNYKGKYYFDGFLNLVLDRTGSGFGVDHTEPLKTGVFIHEHQITKKVCECQLLNSLDDY